MSSYRSLDDGELVRVYLKDRRNDQAGTEVFYRIEASVSYQYTRSLGRIRMAPGPAGIPDYSGEDFVHDVFGKILSSLADYDPAKASLKTWASRIAENYAKDIWKKVSKSLDRMIPVYDEQDEPVVETLAANGLTAMQQMVVDEIKQALFSALKQVESHDQKMAIYLAYCSDFSIQDIADLLDKPAGTIKSHLARGLASFKQRLVKTYDLQSGDLEAALVACRESGLGITTEEISRIQDAKNRALFERMVQSGTSLAGLSKQSGIAVQEVRKLILREVIEMFKRKFRKLAADVKTGIISEEQLADEITQFIMGLRAMPHAATRGDSIPAIPESESELFAAAELLHLALHSEGQCHVSTPGSFIALAVEKAGLTVPDATKALLLSEDDYVAIISDRVFPDDQLLERIANLLKVDAIQIKQLKEQAARENQHLAATRSLGDDARRQRILNRIKKTYFS